MNNHTVTHIKSTKQEYWVTGEVSSKEVYEDTLELTGEERQTVYGFGGCFNEAGWDVLQTLSEETRASILDELFTEDGLGFNSGRVSIGANDYSLEWYSCDEEKEDYELSHFSIERDRQYSIPYIKEAMKRTPELYLFASPWSPPTWMKTKQVYNYGTLRQEDKVLRAYAKYFIKFVEEYKKEGIDIAQIHVQNEPVADQKFPSCVWTGEELRRFIAEYIGPEFEKSGLQTQLWLGTLNGPFVDILMNGCKALEEYYDQYANTVLADKTARKYLTGVGVQWGGKHVVEQIDVSYPELHIMQTENECGDGANAWEYAEYMFTLMWQYFSHRAERYIYWNMVLPEGGISTWGWRQNSLFTVKEDTLEVTYQPEFYVMKHLSHYVKKGAVLLKTRGHWTANSLAFRNLDGSIVVVVGSNMNREREFTFCYEGGKYSTIIEPHSIHTIVICS